MTKQSCLLKNFLTTLILMTQVSLPLHGFHSRTNLKLHNISVTRNMIKKVRATLDLSKASGPDCIPVYYIPVYCILVVVIVFQWWM